MDKYYAQLVATLEPYFTTKAPFQLPETWRQNIVRFAPWIVLVAAIFGGMAILGLLPFLLGVSLFVGVITPWYTLMAWVSLVALGLQVLLMALSFPGLKNVTESGWKFAFYGSVFSTIYNVFTWLQAPLSNLGSLIGAAIGAYISFFILFQIRGYYTGAKKLAAAPATSEPAK